MNVFTEKQLVRCVITGWVDGWRRTIEIDNRNSSQGNTNPNTTSQKNTSSPGWFGESILVRSNGLFFLGQDLVTHFLEFSEDEFMVLACVMEFLDQSEGQFVAALLDEPTWRFWNQRSVQDIAGRGFRDSLVSYQVRTVQHSRRGLRRALELQGGIAIERMLSQMNIHSQPNWQ